MTPGRLITGLGVVAAAVFGTGLGALATHGSPQPNPASAPPTSAPPTTATPTTVTPTTVTPTTVTPTTAASAAPAGAVQAATASPPATSPPTTAPPTTGPASTAAAAVSPTSADRLPRTGGEEQPLAAAGLELVVAGSALCLAAGRNVDGAALLRTP
ncbi:MAG TPA: hypothetical protein VE990_10690 [Acidimicrobiales bacterium]|nr:hypothetical protein [Acidimicrobiales bacterium]